MTALGLSSLPRVTLAIPGVKHGPAGSISLPLYLNVAPASMHLGFR